MRPIFELLARIRSEQSLPFLLIGGWALQAYGYARQTLDVDCLCSAEDSDAFCNSLKRAGFDQFDSVGAFYRFRHKLNSLLVIDLMMVESLTFKKLWLPAIDFHIDQNSLKVPVFEHFIALKLHAARNEGRSKRDLEDISALLNLRPKAISPAALLDLCERYGPKESTVYLRTFL